MPSIASRIVNDSKLALGAGSARPPSGQNLPPLFHHVPVSPILRCPMPILVSASTPDSLRQFRAGGQIPQYRITPPASLR